LVPGIFEETGVSVFSGEMIGETGVSSDFFSSFLGIEDVAGILLTTHLFWR
jgi:hypothetical protein